MTAATLWARGLHAARGAVSLAREVCRELSDERAYQRHLDAHGRVHTPAEWRRFSDARLKAKFARGRCC